MTQRLSPILAFTALGLLAAAGHSWAQLSGGSSIEPLQPTVTKPVEPGHTVPDLRSTSEPRAPATTQEIESRRGLAAPPVQGMADSIADTRAGQERTASLEKHYDHMQASADERVEAFAVVDGDGDLRVQWTEVQQHGLDIARDFFEQLDGDNSGDLDRSEFVGVGETLSVNP